LKLKLPLFTKRDDSKSWFVAGYFKVKIKGKWRDILAPKLLILDRHEFKGPFKKLPTNHISINPKKPIELPPTKKINSRGNASLHASLHKWFN
jgi:hypothetical protein